MIVTLPYPPSANSMWRYVHGGAIKSSAYRSWLQEALLLLRAQRPEKHLGSFRATIFVVRPDKRRRDLDNLAKCTMDALVQGQVIEDDHMAQSIQLAWAWDTITPGGSVTVSIEPAEFPIFLMGRAA